MLKSTKPAPENSRVLYPGLPEAECEVKYRREGIPFHREVAEWFGSICNELSLESPF
jgi:LDH2 family malate/lactate/ureidoglycolate dehydrogenase